MVRQHHQHHTETLHRDGRVSCRLINRSCGQVRSFKQSAKVYMLKVRKCFCCRWCVINIFLIVFVIHPTASHLLSIRTMWKVGCQLVSDGEGKRGSWGYEWQSCFFTRLASCPDVPPAVPGITQERKGREKIKKGGLVGGREAIGSGELLYYLWGNGMDDRWHNTCQQV